MAVNDEALAQQQKGTGAMFGETWVAYPDDVPLRAKHPGDTRAAFVPWLAHQVRISLVAHSNMPAVEPSTYRTHVQPLCPRWPTAGPLLVRLHHIPTCQASNPKRHVPPLGTAWSSEVGPALSQSVQLTPGGCTRCLADLPGERQNPSAGKLIWETQVLPSCVAWHFMGSLQQRSEAPSLRAAVHLLLTVQPTSTTARIPGKALTLCDASAAATFQSLLLGDCRRTAWSPMLQSMQSACLLAAGGTQCRPLGGAAGINLVDRAAVFRCSRGNGSGHAAGADLHIT